MVSPFHDHSILSSELWSLRYTFLSSQEIRESGPDCPVYKKVITFSLRNKLIILTFWTYLNVKLRLWCLINQNLQKEEFWNDYLSEILKFMPEKSNFQSQAFKLTLERQKARQYDNLNCSYFLIIFWTRGSDYVRIPNARRESKSPTCQGGVLTAVQVGSKQIRARQTVIHFLMTRMFNSKVVAQTKHTVVVKPP